MPLYDVTVEDRTYEVNAPDETTAWQWANYTHRQQKRQAPKAQPQSGGIAAFKAGIEEFGGATSALMGKLGLKDEAKAEEEYQAAKKRAAEIYRPTEKGWTEAPGTKFAELLGGSVPYMAAPLAAGAAAATLPVSGPTALAASLGAAGLTSAGQFTATNLARQMEEGKKLSETELGSAALAAIPQAALDTLSMRMIPGIGRIFGQAGVKVTAENAKEIAEQGLKKTLADYTLKTGKAAGVEGVTEATQQVFERLQAGLSITDPKAREEYFESFLGGAILGGTLAPVGRAVERGGEKREARGLLDAQAQKERADALKAEEERKKSPEYLLDLDARYTDAVAKMRELQTAVKQKPAKDADPAQWAEYNQKVAELKEFTANTMRPVTAEYTPRKAEIAQLKEQQRVAGLSEEDYADYAYEQALKRQPKLPPIEEKPEELSADFADIAPPPVAPKPAPELTYAQRQVQLANNNEAIDRLDAKEQAAGYVPYLMQDPEAARSLVAKQTPIPDVKKSVSNTILAGLKTQLTEYDKQQAAARAQASEALRQRQLMAQTAEEEEASYLEEQRLDAALRGEEAETLRTKVSPEMAALQRMRARYTPGVREGQAPLSSLVDRLVESTQPKPKEPTAEVRTAARVVAGTPDLTTLKDRQVLQNQLSYARAVGDKPTVATVQAKLDALGEAPEGDRGVLTTEEPTSRIADVERPLSPGAKAANVLTRLSQVQLRAFEDLKTLLERVGRADPEKLEPLRSTVNNRVELAKRNVVGAALNELDARRQALGQSALNPEEATRLVGQLNSLLDELTSRSSRFMETPAVAAEAAQMRGTQVVRGATEAIRPPVGERAFTNFDASATALRTEMRDVIEETFGAPPATPAEKRPEPLRLQRVVTPEAQKPLFLTYAPAEEAEPYVEDLFNRAYERKDLSDEDEKLLNRLDAVYSVLPEQEQRLVSEQVSRVANGRGFDAPYELQTAIALGEGLKKPISEEAKAEQGQRELFATQTIDDEARGLNARLQAIDAQIEKERATTRVKGLEQLGTLAGREDRLKSLERQRAVLQARLDLLPEDKKALMARQRELAETTRTVTNLRGEERVQTGEGFIRSTPEEFRRFLRSKKAMELRLKEATAQAARAEKVADAAETKTKDELATPENLQVLLAKAQDAAETASIIRMYIEDRLRPMFMQEDALSAGLMNIDGQLFGGFEKREAIVRGKTVTTSRRKTEEGLITKFEALEKQYTPLLNAYRKNAELRKSAELNLLASGMPQKLSELKTRIDLLKERRADIDTRLSRAIEMREKVRKDALSAEPTVKAFAEEKQAIEAYTSLKERLSTQAAQTNTRLRGIKLLEAERARASKKESPLAAIESRVVSTTRVFRDTNAPEVREAVDKEKKVIALNEAKVEAAQTELDKAKAAGNVEEVEGYQDQIKEYTRNVEAARERLYDALNKAPLKRVTPDTEAQAREAAETDAKERQLVYELFKSFYAAANLPVPKLAASYRGPVVTAAAGEPSALRTGSQESRAGKTATPIGLAPKKAPPSAAVTRAKEAASVASSIDQLVKAKAELKSAQEQLARLQESSNIPAARAKAAAVLRKLKANAPAADASISAKKNYAFELEKAEARVRTLAARAKTEITEEKVKAAEALSKKLRSKIDSLSKQISTLEKLVKGEATEAAGGKRAFKQLSKETRISMRGPQTPEMRAVDEAGDIEFSRGPTEFPSTTANVRTELSKVFPDLGRVQIYDSVDALIAANPQYKGLIESDVRGFVDTAGNKAFLIAENINKGDALAVLLHEVGAHIGLKNMLGEAQYNALVKAVETWAKKNDGSTESRVAQAAQERVKAAKTPANQKDDETLAYAIEEAVKAGVTPTQTKTPLGQWLGRIAQAFRKALEKFGLPPKSLDAQGLVDMAFGAAKMEMEGDVKTVQVKGEKTEPGEILFSRNLPTASRVADSLIAKEKGWLTKLKDNFLGMGGRMQYVDKLASSEEALKRGGTDPTKALQAMYYLRMYDQRMHFTSQSITDGVPELVEKTRRDGQTERLIETKPGANIKQIVDILKGKDVVKAAGSADAANKLFTLYLAAIRGERVGYDTLNFGRVWAEAEVKRIESQLKATNISQEQRAVLQKRKKSLEEKIPTMPTAADIKAARAEIEADPTLKEAFDEARDIYNQYNRNLLEFSVQTGALSREQANDYLRNNDYIPYYRMRDGVAELVIGNETPIRIGNLKDSPHLKELVGGDEAIFDFLTSSVQNTSMLLDMATKNLATKNLMFELRDVGLAKVSKVSKGGKVPEGVVTFKRDGEDYFAVVDTEAVGLDSELLVKGLAGIPTMFPAFVRVMGVPARFLRRAVVASPVYMARQLFRDTLAASMTSGADIVPVLSALKQIGKPNALQGRGITGGQVFTGMPEDQTRMLKDMQAGKISVTNGLAWLEAKSAQVDALTRQAQYESYIKQGLSEMEATYMALESMNFSKRGLSPTIHMLSTLIPFFNAQIQGLDVLYKAFTGKMPMNERVAIREKLWTRGMMLFGMSVAYAMYMQDDETYKNAKPEEKYGNWFVRVPGFEQMVRLPIPFELGYVFKALPEALVNIAMREDGAEEAMKALKHISQQMVPGGSSFMIPQALKPALEVLYGKSLYTLRDIESAREQMVEPGYRSRDNTTALAREVGELTGFSPIKMEYLIRGYTGGMGMALLAALSAPFGKEGPEAATKRASDIPVVGTLFQPNDASGIIDATYERINEINRIKETYESLLEKGRQADAEKYLKENIDEMALASVAGSFKQYMGQITTYERQIRASNMTPDQKREQLDKMRQAKINLATSVRAMTERKTPQAAPA